MLRITEEEATLLKILDEDYGSRDSKVDTGLSGPATLPNKAGSILEAALLPVEEIG